MSEAQAFSGSPSGGALRSKFGRGSVFARSFSQGMLYGAILFALMVAWMAVRAGDTAKRLQDIVPAKSATLEEVSAPIPAAKDPNAPSNPLNDGKKLAALPPAPLEGLFESNNGLQLPKSRIADDMTPFAAYKKPFTPIPGRALVSFVVVDYGLSALIAQSLLDNTPGEITFVLSPYADEPAKWAASARAFGHEFWLTLPMQTQSFATNDTGPDTILANGSDAENQARLFKVMSLAPGYAGLVSGQNHILSGNEKITPPLMKQIFGRGLAFAESNPDLPAFGLSMAMEFGYPYVQNNFWLDADLRPAAVDALLKQVELQATQKGKAVIFLHPYPAILGKVQEFIKDAEGKGLQVAPLSAMVL